MILPFILLAARVYADSLNDVEHIIIFMQENRAFDHYFGTLQGVRGFNDRITVPLPSGLNSFYQPTDQKHLENYQLPYRADTTSTSAMCMDAPEMNYECDIRILNNGHYDSWNTARSPGLYYRIDLLFVLTIRKQGQECHISLAKICHTTTLYMTTSQRAINTFSPHLRRRIQIVFICFLVPMVYQLVRRLCWTIPNLDLDLIGPPWLNYWRKHTYLGGNITYMYI